MASRTVTDTAGRTWTCTSEVPATEQGGSAQGQDVVLSCTTPSITDPMKLTVGWQWETMAPTGLARLLNQMSPAPRR